MRAICKVCSEKDSCSYIKCGREGDCIDVQTSDYGYDEAVEKACEWLSNSIIEFVEFDHLNGIQIDYGQLDNEFRKAMES